MFNTGQVLLVLGAVLLFAMMLPSLNEAILYNDLNQLVTQVESSALGLAQGFLSEAATKAFDENTITVVPLFPDQLTPTDSLGSDVGENYPNFDDLDDFADLALVDTTAFASIQFTVAGAVDYMNPNNPGIISLSQTFIKRLRVTVTSSFLIDPVTRDSLQVMLERLYTYY